MYKIIGCDSEVTPGPRKTSGALSDRDAALAQWRCRRDPTKATPLPGGEVPVFRGRCSACFRKVLILERTEADEGRAPSSARVPVY